MGYKPDRKTLEIISTKLPDCRIIGFEIYRRTIISTTWCLLVESGYFPEDDQPGFITFSISAIPIMGKPRHLHVLNNFDGDSSA